MRQIAQMSNSLKLHPIGTAVDGSIGKTHETRAVLVPRYIPHQMVVSIGFQTAILFVYQLLHLIPKSKNIYHAIVQIKIELRIQ